MSGADIKISSSMRWTDLKLIDDGSDTYMAGSKKMLE